MAEKNKSQEKENETPVLISKESLGEKLSKGFFQTRAIIEIVGKPKEHIETALQDFVLNISKNDKYGLISYNSEEAEQVPDSEELFTTFSEIEFTAKNMDELMDFVINYMPASIEIVEPASLNVQANFLSNMLNELVGKLHLVDMEFKKIKAQNNILGQSLGIMIQNATLILLNLGPKTIEEISKTVGVAKDQAETFINKLVKDNKIKEEGGKYSLVAKK